MASYNSINKNLVNVFKTYPTKESNKSLIKIDGDLTKIKTHNIFNKHIASKKLYADLITADGGFKWKDENYQEQEAYRLVMGQIVSALRVQAKNGTFVLKLFETFTDLQLNLLHFVVHFLKKLICINLLCLEFQIQKNTLSLKNLNMIQ